MEQWRKDAIKDGFVCIDCHEPIAKYDREGFVARGRRCRPCWEQNERIRIRTQIERALKPICE